NRNCGRGAARVNEPRVAALLFALATPPSRSLATAAGSPAPIAAIVAVARLVAAAVNLDATGVVAFASAQSASMSGRSDAGLEIDAFRRDSSTESSPANRSANAGVGMGGLFALNQCAAV